MHNMKSSKEITNPLWDIRGEYLTKMWNISKTVYNEFGGFVKGKDLSGNDMFFLIQPDGRIPIQFKVTGYFDTNVDPLELDVYGDLETVDYKEFKERFSELDNLLCNKYMEGEKYREHLLRDLQVAEHLITDEMFNQMRKNNE